MQQVPVYNGWSIVAVLVAVFIAAVVIASLMHRSPASSPTTPATHRVVPCYDSSGGVHPSYDGMSC